MTEDVAYSPVPGQSSLIELYPQLSYLNRSQSGKPSFSAGGIVTVTKNSGRMIILAGPADCKLAG